MRFTPTSDERLMQLAAGGSAAAFSTIFTRHRAGLDRYCHSILGDPDDADDALQNTMLRALRALPGETRTIALRPWLYRIAHNESVSLLRARRPADALERDAAAQQLVAEDPIEARARLHDVADDLRELTDQQRRALLLREFAGWELADIAAALDISPAAAKQTLYDARSSLRALDEGRAMACAAVRRAVAEGDRRILRGLRIRGHLRDCADCRAREAAQRADGSRRLAVAPSVLVLLHDTLLRGGMSLAAKLATVAAVGGSVIGAVEVAPRLIALERPIAAAATLPAAAGSRVTAPQPALPDVLVGVLAGSPAAGSLRTDLRLPAPALDAPRRSPLAAVAPGAAAGPAAPVAAPVPSHAPAPAPSSIPQSAPAGDAGPAATAAPSAPATGHQPATGRPPAPPGQANAVPRGRPDPPVGRPGAHVSRPQAAGGAGSSPPASAATPEHAVQAKGAAAASSRPAAAAGPATGGGKPAELP